MSQNNGSSTSLRLKTGLAEMLKGGVIMDVTNAEQASIAEKAGAVAGMALERGARNLGEALRRIAEGAAMIRTKGEAGTGDVVHAVKHIRQIVQEMKILTVLGEEEVYAKAKEHGAPYELVRMVAKTGKLPVPNFSAGGIATPADASLVMQLGAEAVFVGSGIFKSSDPAQRARAIVKATTHYKDPKVVLEASEELGDAMKGLDIRQLEEKDLMQTRGW